MPSLRSLSLALALTSSLAHAAALALPASATALTTCLSTKNVPTVLSTNANWTTYEATYNTRLQYIPAAIALPSTAQHVSDAVVCAATSNVPVQAKSGGHSYASYSTGGRDGILVVDLENFQNVSIDAASGVATVGAGLRLGNLATAIYNQGKRALAHGTCPGVGIGGHFLHGGYGYSSRAWGLALDQITALDVVLANGSYVHASASQYPDVYYAMRGAGDSFGIVVTFYLQTHAAPSTIVTFEYDLDNMFSNVSSTIAAFNHIQDFAQNASVVDRNLGFGIYLDGYGFSISGTYIGTLANFKKNIQPELLRGLPNASSSPGAVARSWIDSLIWLSGASTLSVPVHGYSAHDNFFAKSVTVPKAFGKTQLTSYVNYVFNKGLNPPTSWFSIFNLYGGPDSQINVPTADFAAYADRSSLWVVQNYGYADAAAAFTTADTSFVDGLNSALTSGLSSGSYGAYLNYVDPSLSADQAHSLYYGADLYAKLQGIKKEVDPGNVFQNPQSIVPDAN